ncbi:TPA: hypothetical protein I8V27_002331 [Corynebacterium striatum]|nr:hypothetical protein [Corynebacterium striatum]HAT1158413.1 hypothetical protein [Corynebacterium striatum]HAT1161160.1 hypothetical protein [Corynebacterium striatum]HAT1163873.1 hypothetical protein [Corynebacterium striatum]HAT1166628.1 hypothetical protein [Corynebacterium striatum]
MRRPYFVADSASVTVLHSVASSAFGKYSLTVPEGVDIEDVYTLSAPGNELGYVAQLSPSGRRVGGFARRFVRADVSVRSIGESNDDTWTAASDVDTTLKEAASRVQGDFFLESDISLAGLGPWVPFEHFDVGDIADVEIWGRVVPLPVTRIEPIVSDHSIVDWRIHVGGQLVSDDEARLAENDVVRRAVVDSRRDLAGVAEAASKAVETASSAVSKADAAQGTADSAVGDAAALREVLSGAGATADDVRSQLVELNRKIQERGESQDSLPLIPAYIAANTARWRVQDELDALQDEQIALTRRLAEANRKALEIQAEMNAVFARRRPQVLSFSKNGAGNDLVTVKTGGNLTVTAKGSWTGVIAVSARVDALSAYAINDAVEVTSWQRSWEWKVGTFESSGGGYVIIMPN